jgi:glycosyltransferase involved in cell wall biosynthesis
MIPFETTGLLYDDLGSIVAEAVRGLHGAPPRISIVTPSYNQGEYLEETLVSLLAQGYPNLELIVIDGGSTDGSVDVIRRYERHLAYWQSQPDAGQYDAIQQGLRRCTGEVMGWLNSDDKHHPGSLTTIAETFANHPEVEWLTGRPTIWNDKGALSEVHPLQIWHAERLLRDRPPYFIQQESTFWRRSLWEKAGSRLATDLKLAGDFELWVRFFRSARLYTLDALLGGFRVQAKQKTASGMPRYYAEVASVVKRELARPDARERLPAAIEDRELRNAAAVEVFTHLAPDAFDRQGPAVSSWALGGARLVSLNASRDIDRLRKHYPDVEFRPAANIGLDALVSAAAGSKAPVAGIIFPDLILRGGSGLAGEIAAAAATGPTLVHDQYVLSERAVEGIDLRVYAVSGSSTKRYSRFADHYPGVFAPPAWFSRAPRSALPWLGPWSDYWLPMHAVHSGQPLKMMDRAVAARLWPPASLPTPDVLFDTLRPLIDGQTRSVLASLERLYPGGDRLSDRFKAPKVAADLTAYSIRKHLRSIPATHKMPFNEAIRRHASAHPIRVTAIVSTYSSAAFIGECLEDLVTQTIRDQIEIIVIDAASPENEAEVVRRYQERHPHIRYVRTPARIGVYAAWNMAIRMARGDYLISCSTNDRLAGDAIETLTRTLDENITIAVAYGNSFLTQRPHERFEDFTLSGLYLWESATTTELLKAPNVGPHPMWRRSLHDELGLFDESLKAIADQDFWLRVAARHRLECIEDFTGLYYVDDGSLSGDRTTASSEIRLVHERHSRPYFYRFWTSDHCLGKAHGLQYDRHLETREQPTRFALAVVHDSTDTAPLVDTIQNLTGNYYSHFSIVVLSRAAAPHGLAAGRIVWCQADAPCIALAWQIMVTQQFDHPPDWVVALAAGDRLAPHALLVLDEAIATNPGWSAIYSDEDQLASDGERSHPRFKPAPDLTLLRETAYLGELFACRLDLLRAFAPAGFHNSPAATYDLALRLAEANGIRALGHIADVLCHRPARPPAPHTREATLDALLDHLRRCVPGAEVTSGLAADATRVRYPLNAPPRVSILLACPDDALIVQDYLAAFLERMTYPDWEILFYAPTTGRPLLEFLGGIAGLGDPRLRVQPEGHDRVGSAFAGRTPASGTFLLFADATTPPLHAGWLEALVEHALRTDVGAVGARLVFANGQIDSAAPVFGFLGIQGSPYRGFPVDRHGDQDLLAFAQERTVVDPRCLLVGTETLRKVARPDPEPCSDHVALTDLCLRIRQAGLAVVWTPFATLRAAGDAFGQEPQDIARVEDAPDPAPDEDRCFRRWLPTLPFDPAHNPNISRARRGYKIEADAALNWRPLPWLPAPRCIGYVADFAGCGYYRAIDPMDALARAGRNRPGAGRHLPVSAPIQGRTDPPHRASPALLQRPSGL